MFSIAHLHISFMTIISSMDNTSSSDSESKHRHIVIGAGTAGVVLARRLLDAGDDVVLVERY